MAKVGRKAVVKVSTASRKKVLTTEILLIAAFVFFVALVVRLFGIMDIGITWDEPIYVKSALSYIDYLPKYGIFSSATWQVNFEHPQISKMIYAVAINFVNGFSYNLDTFYTARCVSAIMSALTCVLVFFIGSEVYDKRVGTLAALILALFPLVVAHGQIAGLESPLAFFFTLSIFLFLIAMKTGNQTTYALSAVAMGLTIGTKLNGLLVLPIVALMYIGYVYLTKKKVDVKNILMYGAGCFAIMAATIVLLWPWIWSDLGTLTTDPLNNLMMTLNHWSYVPMEYFLGTFQQAPIYYLPLYFLVSTPLLVLALVAVGAYFTIRSKDPYRLGILVWLIIPFFYGLYSMVQDGTRYIFMIYPAVALLGAFGLSSLVTRVQQARPKLGDERTIFNVVSMILILYLVISLVSVRPYYLDYYNTLSGGQKNIQENRLLEFGWWGEGIKQCVDYVENHGTTGSTVLMATLPTDRDHWGMYADKMTYIIIGQTDNGFAVFNFGEKKTATMDNSNASKSYAWNADYIIVNTQFNEYGKNLMDSSKYTAVYSASVNGAPMCTVYKKN